MYYAVGSYTQTDDVTAQVKLPLFNDMDGAVLLFLHLDGFAATSSNTQTTELMKAARRHSNTSIMSLCHTRSNNGSDLTLEWPWPGSFDL